MSLRLINLLNCESPINSMKDFTPKEKRKLFKEWSNAVRVVGKCEVCSSTTRLNAHHILDRKYYHAYRFDVNNGICLCPSCHKFGKFSAHKNPIWFVRWLKANKPEQFVWVSRRTGRKATVVPKENSF
jgi:hypothetical protein